MALPSHLKYAFCRSGETLLMIVAADLLDHQVVELTSVLTRFIKIIGWTIADIIKIPPSICSQKDKFDQVLEA